MKRMKVVLTALVIVLIALFSTGCTDPNVAVAYILADLINSDDSDKIKRVVTPKISPTSDTFVISQEISITSDTGARIYYTVDGSAPVVGGSTTSEYVGVFAIGVDTVIGEITVRAIAVKADHVNSLEATKTVTKESVLATVEVRSGTFRMGSLSGVGDSYEEPQHKVTLTKGFYMGESEVTQGQYVAVISIGNPIFTNPSSNQTSDAHPVELVSWNDAVAFCNALSEAEGLEPYYTINSSTVKIEGGLGYRLPTEAEWEYAAGGGEKTSSYTRTKYAGTDEERDLSKYAVYSTSSTAEVKSKRVNALGLYDMSGNVGEWCWDWYGSYSAGATSDPTGSGTGSERVIRGGSYGNSADYARVAVRNFISPSYRNITLGFRVVRSASQ